MKIKVTPIQVLRTIPSQFVHGTTNTMPNVGVTYYARKLFVSSNWWELFPSHESPAKAKLQASGAVTANWDKPLFKLNVLTVKVHCKEGDEVEIEARK